MHYLIPGRGADLSAMRLEIRLAGSAKGEAGDDTPKWLCDLRFIHIPIAADHAFSVKDVARLIDEESIPSQFGLSALVLGTPSGSTCLSSVEDFIKERQGQGATDDTTDVSKDLAGVIVSKAAVLVFDGSKVPSAENRYKVDGWADTLAAAGHASEGDHAVFTRWSGGICGGGNLGFIPKSSWVGQHMTAEYVQSSDGQDGLKIEVKNTGLSTLVDKFLEAASGCFLGCDDCHRDRKNHFIIVFVRQPAVEQVNM